MQFGFGLDNFANFKAVRRNFFDRAKVMRATSDATRKTLSRAGAYVMTTARGLIRTAKNWDDYSKPGKPPKSHQGMLKDKPGILFAYDENNRSVVVGPTPLNGGERGIPALLEFGGDVVRYRNGIDRIRATRLGQKIEASRTYVAHYEPRPYMGPALAKNIEKAPDLFENTIKDYAGPAA